MAILHYLVRYSFADHFRTDQLAPAFQIQTNSQSGDRVEQLHCRLSKTTAAAWKKTLLQDHPLKPLPMISTIHEDHGCLQLAVVSRAPRMETRGTAGMKKRRRDNQWKDSLAWKEWLDSWTCFFLLASINPYTIGSLTLGTFFITRDSHSISELFKI